MTKTEKDTRYGPVVAEYNSTRNPALRYEVRYKGGKYSCNCPGWAFRKHCRHTDHAEQSQLRPGGDRDDSPPETLVLCRELLDEGLRAMALSAARKAKNVNNKDIAARRMLKVLNKWLAENHAVAAPEPEASEPDALAVGVKKAGVRLITLD